MRSQSDIVERIRGTRDTDTLGFQFQALSEFLSADQLKEFCKKDADLSSWKETPPVEENVISTMRGYMEFAWGKVQNHRGISAGRSIAKMQEWLWILGDEQLADFAQDPANYPQYGAPILEKICEKYEFDMPDSVDLRRMARGESCPSCQDGSQLGCG